MSIESVIASNAAWLNSLGTSIDQVYYMVTGASYIIGCSFLFKALYSLKVYGELRTMMASNTSLKEPLTYIMVASVFIFLPTGFDILLNTSFGYNSVLAYTDLPAGLTFTAANGGETLLKLLQLIGVIAFIRGWVVVARSQGQGSQPGTFGKGLTHMFGGVLLMNIVGTIDVMYNTLGITF